MVKTVGAAGRDGAIRSYPQALMHVVCSCTDAMWTNTTTITVSRTVLHRWRLHADRCAMRKSSLPAEFRMETDFEHRLRNRTHTRAMWAIRQRLSSRERERIVLGLLRLLRIVCVHFSSLELENFKKIRTRTLQQPLVCLHPGAPFDLVCASRYNSQLNKWLVSWKSVLWENFLEESFFDFLMKVFYEEKSLLMAWNDATNILHAPASYLW